MRFFPVIHCDTSTLPPFSASSSSSSPPSRPASSSSEEPESCPYLPPPSVRVKSSSESKKNSFFSIEMSIGRNPKPEPSMSVIESGAMIFERMRDRLLRGPFAPMPFFDGPSAKDSKSTPQMGHGISLKAGSLKALNALLDSSYSQGYYDASLLPPPYLVEEDEAKYRSHLAPGLVNFASHYPLITIAGMGVLATTTFFAAAGLTGIALRRLGASGQVARRRSLDVRMDDLERRLVDTLAAQSSSRTAQIADLRSEMLRILSSRGAALGSSGAAKNGKAAGKPSAEAPVASRVEEARLSQIITEALEGVVATKNGTGLLVAAPRSEGDEGAEAKLDRITTLLEELQKSIKSPPRSAVPSGLASAIGGDSNIMSLSDISSAVRQIQNKQSQSSETGRVDPAHLAGTPAETLVSEFDRAAQSALPISRREAPPPAAPDQASHARERYDPNSSHQRDIRKRRDAGTAAANQAHQERVDCTAHLSEDEKACRAKERGDMASRMKQEAENHAQRMKELMAKTFSSGSGAPMAKAYQATRWEGQVEESSPSSSASPSEPYDSTMGGRKEGLSGSESAPRVPPATAPKSETKETPSAPSPSSAKERLQETGYTVTKPTRPPFGVDDSGDWSFQVMNPVPQSGWKEVYILLRMSKSGQVFDKGQMWTSWT